MKPLVKTGTEIESRLAQKAIKTVDYYFENGLLVMTADFLLKRGYCCDNGCRHCPYPKQHKKEL